MTNRNIVKYLVAAVKIVTVAIAALNLPELKEAIGDEASWITIAFTSASALKDLLVTTLDYLDDGKANGSFTLDQVASAQKRVVPMLAVAFITAVGAMSISSCTVTVGADGKPVFRADYKAIEAFTEDRLQDLNDRIQRAKTLDEK